MNDHILFRSDSLTEAASELKRIIDALEDVAGDLARVDTSEEWWSKLNIYTSRGRYDGLGAVRMLKSSTQTARENVADINEGIRKTQALFTETDRAITSRAVAALTGKQFDKYGEPGSGTGASTASGGFGSVISALPIDWNRFKPLGPGGFLKPINPLDLLKPGKLIDSVLDHYKNKIVNGAKTAVEAGKQFVSDVKDTAEKLWDGLKTGAKQIKGKLSDCVTAIKKDWNDKGITYRVVKGIGAVADIAVGAATVVGAVMGTGITAGLGTPATVLVGTYGANQFVNGCADLFNCITGDVDKVGNVNVLKSITSGITGQVGEWLGNRKIGESIGNAIYSVGELGTVAVNITALSGKIKQAHTSASTLSKSVEAGKKLLSEAGKELPNAIKGIGYIVQNPGSGIRYNLHMLSKQVPNIMKVVSDTELVIKGVQTGQKLIDKGIQVVNDLAGYNMVNKPEFMPELKTVKDAISAPGDMIDKVKESGDTISDAFKVFQIVF